MFLLGLLSAVLIAVAFRHFATINHRSLLLYFLLFFRTILFSLLGLLCHSSLLSAIFYFRCHFYCRAIYIAAVHFVACCSVRQQLLWLFIHSFKAGPFFVGSPFCSGPLVAIFILLLKTLSL